MELRLVRGSAKGAVPLPVGEDGHDYRPLTARSVKLTEKDVLPAREPEFPRGEGAGLLHVQSVAGGVGRGTAGSEENHKKNAAEIR